MKTVPPKLWYPFTKPKVVAAQMKIVMYGLKHSNKLCPRGLISCLKDSTRLSIEFQLKWTRRCFPRKLKKFKRQWGRKRHDDGPEVLVFLFKFILRYLWYVTSRCVNQVRWQAYWYGCLMALAVSNELASRNGQWPRLYKMFNTIVCTQYVLR
jgi:hypothetical protein